MNGGPCQCGGNCGCAARELEGAWFQVSKEAARIPKRVEVRWDLGKGKPEYGEKDFKKTLKKLRLPDRVKVPKDRIEMWEEDDRDNDVIDQWLTDEYGYLHAGWKIVGSEVKLAADMKKLLADIFRSAQPHVKNWRKFLVSMEEELKYWGTGMVFPYESKLVKIDVDTIYDEVGSYEVDSGSYYDPPDEVPVQAEVPVGFDFHVQHTLDLRKLPLQLHKSMRSNITDAKGFMQAISDVTSNSAAMNMLGKVMIAVVRNYARDGQAAGEFLSELDNDGVWQEINDELHDSIDGPVTPVEYFDLDHTLVKKVWYKLTGKGVAVNITGVCTIEQPDWSFEEQENIWESTDEYGDSYMTDGRRRVYMGSKLLKAWFKA